MQPDERPHRARETGLLFEIFRSLHEDDSIKPQPVSLDFALSSKVLPLQAADLFAWETYQHATDRVKRGQKPFEFRRETLKKLTRSKRFGPTESGLVLVKTQL
jgi:hypothetical protein